MGAIDRCQSQYSVRWNPQPSLNSPEKRSIPSIERLFPHFVSHARAAVPPVYRRRNVRSATANPGTAHACGRDPPGIPTGMTAIEIITATEANGLNQPVSRGSAACFARLLLHSMIAMIRIGCRHRPVASFGTHDSVRGVPKAIGALKGANSVWRAAAVH